MIRAAAPEDLSEIAIVHAQCFPDSFSTALGKGYHGSLLVKFFEEYLKKVPELFFVAVSDENKIIGYCMGYYINGNNFTKNFLKHNFFKISFQMLRLLLSGNRIAWKKILSLFYRKKSPVQAAPDEIRNLPCEKKGDLLSICVLPPQQGSGTAASLINTFHESLLKNGKTLCFLSVKPENKRAIRFYEKNGYRTYGDSPESIVLFKILDDQTLSCNGSIPLS